MLYSRTAQQVTAVTAAAAVLAAGYEGLKYIAYEDPRPGDPILTVCYGSTTDVEVDKVYTLAECKERLNADMREAVLIVDRCAPGLPDGVLIAFADAVYNIGPKVACDTKRSTAARMLKAGRIEEACHELPKWNKSNGVVLKGLTRRRAEEKRICLESVRR